MKSANEHPIIKTSDKYEIHIFAKTQKIQFYRRKIFNDQVVRGSLAFVLHRKNFPPGLWKQVWSFMEQWQ